MASPYTSKTLAFFVFALFVQVALGKIECQNLSKDTCSYAVSYVGKRCVLEKHVRRSGVEEYTCGTSEIEAAGRMKDWIESDECIKACGLDRSALGISSDSMLESHFAGKLCSDECYGGCPNIVDLYFNLAAGEGVYLPKLCEAQGTNKRREMAEIKSSGYVAPGPESSSKYVNGVNFVYAPSTAPSYYY
ncbi:hypothetical protein ABFS82_06G033200 [Erythranthe guttata]|uniref:PAR1 protein n=1 Tax=Erythranthe guttata TaxID=4155 RepID=A0A022QBU9_ERYGU|nr:PREDICTED: uncharacterized protein LOC105971910 [Erythranthe guttata]EYU25099.1 hypothetical protein MIMGU_mgv1a014446mg [Erythranthe guttata]|eukprot:XP_012852292.1 PREDICTED: uncharacterized protein LOC105971910 [Erythranthe guttata]